MTTLVYDLFLHCIHHTSDLFITNIQSIDLVEQPFHRLKARSSSLIDIHTTYLEIAGAQIIGSHWARLHLWNKNRLKKLKYYSPNHQKVDMILSCSIVTDAKTKSLNVPDVCKVSFWKRKEAPPLEHPSLRVTQRGRHTLCILQEIRCI